MEINIKHYNNKTNEYDLLMTLLTHEYDLSFTKLTHDYDLH